MWVNRHIPEVICTGGYEWLVTVVSIVYLLTFCVFELRYLEWCHRSLVVKGELTRCNELITYTDV